MEIAVTTNSSDQLAKDKLVFRADTEREENIFYLSQSQHILESVLTAEPDKIIITVTSSQLGTVWNATLYAPFPAKCTFNILYK